MPEDNPIPEITSLAEKRTGLLLAKETLKLAQEIIGFIDPNVLSIDEFDELRGVKTTLHRLEQSMALQYIELNAVIASRMQNEKEVLQ